MAESVSSYDGVSKVIAVKSDIFSGSDSSGWASALDSATPSGTILCLATARNDVASRLAARRGCQLFRMLYQSMATTSPLRSTQEKRIKPLL